MMMDDDDDEFGRNLEWSGVESATASTKATPIESSERDRE
jgi:hypothetical protein